MKESIRVIHAIRNEMCPELQLDETPKYPRHYISVLVDPTGRPFKLNIEVSKDPHPCDLLIRAIVFGGKSAQNIAALFDGKAKMTWAVVVREISNGNSWVWKPFFTHLILPPALFCAIYSD